MEEKKFIENLSQELQHKIDLFFSNTNIPENMKKVFHRIIKMTYEEGDKSKSHKN